jgi:hypothetical protein
MLAMPIVLVLHYMGIVSVWELLPIPAMQTPPNPNYPPNLEM